MEFALRLADFCYIMEKGSIVFQGDVSELTKDDIKSPSGHIGRLTE